MIHQRAKTLLESEFVMGPHILQKRYFIFFNSLGEKTECERKFKGSFCYFCQFTWSWRLILSGQCLWIARLGCCPYLSYLALWIVPRSGSTWLLKGWSELFSKPGLKWLCLCWLLTPSLTPPLLPFDSLGKSLSIKVYVAICQLCPAHWCSRTNISLLPWRG